jgi:hypothetical protein
MGEDNNGRERELSNQRSSQYQGMRRHHEEGGGMTLEDDVESMLSENNLN